MTQGVAAAIRAALLTGEPRAKVMAARRVARDWRLGRLERRFEVPMPERPAWPAALTLVPANRMPKRGRGGSLRNRIALWHSLAHIEFVAIDLALDMAGKFGAEMGPKIGRAFVADFLSIAVDEAMHFALIDRKLEALGARYGALPAHGLWEAAEKTRHDLAARLAVVPMVLEARGLDVTPATLEHARAAGDETGARILERILDDEIRHVAIGTKHFHETSLARGELPREFWRNLVKSHFPSPLKPPFNDSARRAAGLSRSWYASVA